MAKERVPSDPLDVLATVRRLEAEVTALRDRSPFAQNEALLKALADDREAAVQDLHQIVELIAASWRSTRGELTALRSELSELRAEVAESRVSLDGARLELRVAGPGNGSAGEPAADRSRRRTPRDALRLRPERA